MNIIVIGMGEVGKHIAQVLTGEDHNVKIVDSDPDVLNRASGQLDAMSMLGQGAAPSTLKKLGIERCDILIAVTDNDEINMLACHLGKELGARRTIARVSSSDYLDGDNGFYYNLLGIDLVLSPQTLAAQEIVKLVRSLDAVFIENFADNRIEMMQLPVKEQVPAVGVPLRDLETPPNVLVAAILRNDEILVPGGEDSVQVDDEVFLIGRTEDIGKSEDLFGHKASTPFRKVVIVGGGAIGLSVAGALEQSGHEVYLIDWNRQRCDELADTLSGTEVICGDGTNLSLLQELKVQNADVFITVSRRDEVNLMAALLAKELGVRKTIALVHRADYATIYEHLGVDATISPRRFAAAQILKYVRAGEVVSVSVLEDGKGEVLEIVVPEKAPIVGKPLRDMKIPRGAVLGAVAGPQGVVVPTGETVIAAGSTVIVFTTPAVRPAIEKFFARKRK
jgi:trk system potassium uptake protein TrkA